MEDEININIKIERLDKNISKINDEIREFIFKLRGLCKVTNYSQIETKMVNLNEKKEI